MQSRTRGNPRVIPHHTAHIIKVVLCACGAALARSIVTRASSEQLQKAVVQRKWSKTPAMGYSSL